MAECKELTIRFFERLGPEYSPELNGRREYGTYTVKLEYLQNGELKTAERDGCKFTRIFKAQDRDLTRHGSFPIPCHGAIRIDGQEKELIYDLPTVTAVQTKLRGVPAILVPVGAEAARSIIDEETKADFDRLPKRPTIVGWAKTDARYVLKVILERIEAPESIHCYVPSGEMYCYRLVKALIWFRDN